MVEDYLGLKEMWNAFGFPLWSMKPLPQGRRKRSNVVNVRRIKWKDKPDFIRGRYFVFSIFYGLFYMCGAYIGYMRSHNIFCLIFSGVSGLVIELLSIG